MTKQTLDDLKTDYMQIEIPDQLDFIVRKTLKEAGAMNQKKKIRQWTIPASLVATLAIAVSGIGITAQTNPAFAQQFADTPVIGTIIKVFTQFEFNLNEKHFDASMKAPKVSGMTNQALQASINEKYLEENKTLYKTFMTEMAALKKQGAGNIGAFSGYEVKTDNDRLLSICRWQTTTAADSNTILKYDTIDKKNQVLITLPSLFKDDQYVKVISANIIEQMKAQVAKGDAVYWLDDGETMPEDVFKSIQKDQNFYINKDHQLVISFNQFDVAPGYMGTPEFVIPSDLLKDLLVSSDYIY